jgi:hypothetical protein
LNAAQAQLAELTDEDLGRSPNPFKEEFDALPPNQKALGRLVGKLLGCAHLGNKPIEDAFTWFEQECPDGFQMSNLNKIETMLHVIMHAGIDSPATYAACRKLFVQAMQKL